MKQSTSSFQALVNFRSLRVILLTLYKICRSSVMVAETLSMFLKALDREKAKAIFKVAMISPVEVKLVVFFSPARML